MEFATEGAITTSQRRQGRPARSSASLLLALGREHAEDPAYSTLMPYPNIFAWRLIMLVFFDREEATGDVERLEVNPYGSGPSESTILSPYSIKEPVTHSSPVS